MAFYYTTILSIVPLGFAYAVAALVYALIWWVSRGAKVRVLVRAVAGVVLLLLPVSEELWIAWNFARACESAGTFITKKVQVEGFYDDTTGWGPRQLAESQYKFMESRDILNRKLLRVEAADASERDSALAWYAKQNQRADADTRFVVQPINDKEQIVVGPNHRDAWRVTTIDHPTARYWFKHTDPMNGTRIAHKVGRSGSLVIDSQTNEEIARYTNFGREPPWYWLSLGVPPYACDAPGRWPNTSGPALVYSEALIPAVDK